MPIAIEIIVFILNKFYKLGYKDIIFFQQLLNR